MDYWHEMIAEFEAMNEYNQLQEEYIEHYRLKFRGFLPSPLKARGERYNWTRGLERLTGLLRLERFDNADLEHLQWEARRRELEGRNGTDNL